MTDACPPIPAVRTSTRKGSAEDSSPKGDSGARSEAVIKIDQRINKQKTAVEDQHSFLPTFDSEAV
ncbi:MAG: hypothetical protein CMB73_05825 [Euryarchaeota archaeon]|jgi:hypothetical protein|nr:hypothetical protein [Euryarchaeota archaeon]